jgi:hypothetical protein
MANDCGSAAGARLAARSAKSQARACPLQPLVMRPAPVPGRGWQGALRTGMVGGEHGG